MTTPQRNPEALESLYRRYRRLTIILAVLSLFLIVVVVGQFTMKPSVLASPESSAKPTADAAQEQQPESSYADSAVVRRDPNDAQAIGAVDAPIVLLQWSDLRCPFCAAFHRDTLPTIVQEYVDKGLVRVEFHDVTYFGEESEDAAVAARAAGNQGKFFEYLDAVFDAAPGNGHPDMPREKLLSFAEAAGVPDIAQFTADLDDPTLREAAQQSTAEAQQLGVSGVPFFVVGNTGLSGAQPADVFQNFLDEALEQVG